MFQSSDRLSSLCSLDVNHFGWAILETPTTRNMGRRTREGIQITVNNSLLRQSHALLLQSLTRHQPPPIKRLYLYMISTCLQGLKDVACQTNIHIGGFMCMKKTRKAIFIVKSSPGGWVKSMSWNPNTDFFSFFFSFFKSNTTVVVEETSAVLSAPACTFLNPLWTLCLWLSCQDAESKAIGYSLRGEQRRDNEIGLGLRGVQASHCLFLLYLFPFLYVVVEYKKSSPRYNMTDFGILVSAYDG